MNWLFTEDKARIETEANKLRAHFRTQASSDQISEEAVADINSVRPTPELDKRIPHASDSELLVICRNLVAERQLRERALSFSLPSFEELYDQENNARKWQRDNLNSLMHAKGHADFNADKLNREFVIGNGRLFTTMPIIAPHFFNGNGVDGGGDGRSQHTTREPWYIADLLNTKIDNYGFGFGAIERTVEAEKTYYNGDTKKWRVYVPVMLLDREVTDTLQSMMKEPKSQDAKLTVGILSGIRTFTGMANHDWFHNLMYHVWDKPRVVEVKLDKPKVIGREWRGQFAAGDGWINVTTNREIREFGRAIRRSDLANPEAPLYRSNDPAIHQRIYPEDPSDPVFAAPERHAYYANRDVWQHAFEEKPQVKKALLHNAVSYLENLNAFKKRITETLGAQKADAITAYLATVGMGQFYVIMRMDDPDLSKPAKDGISVKAAVEALHLQSYSIPLKSVRAIYKQYQPSNIQPNITQLEEFIQSPPKSLVSVHRYTVQKLQNWLNEKHATLDSMKLEGMEGLEARVMLNGFSPSSWLNNEYKRDKTAADVTASFARRMQEIDKGPAFTEAVNNFSRN